MAEEKETKAAKAAPTLTISMDELQQLVTAAVSAATQASAATVAAAVVEAKKPVVDERHAYNDEQMRQSTKIQRERDAENTRISQESCPHRQGSNDLSSFQGPLSSFVVHVLDTGLPVAICTNCLMKVYGDDDNPEHIKKAFRDKSGNGRSAAGQRHFRDPEKAMKAGR